MDSAIADAGWFRKNRRGMKASFPDRENGANIRKINELQRPIKRTFKGILKNELKKYYRDSAFCFSEVIRRSRPGPEPPSRPRWKPATGLRLYKYSQGDCVAVVLFWWWGLHIYVFPIWFFLSIGCWQVACNLLTVCLWWLFLVDIEVGFNLLVTCSPAYLCGDAPKPPMSPDPSGLLLWFFFWDFRKNCVIVMCVNAV